MEQILEYMKREGEKIMNDLEKIKNFDFENANEEELEQFQLALQKQMEHNKKVEQDFTKMMNKLKERN